MFFPCLSAFCYLSFLFFCVFIFLFFFSCYFYFFFLILLYLLTKLFISLFRNGPSLGNILCALLFSTRLIMKDLLSLPLVVSVLVNTFLGLGSQWLYVQGWVRFIDSFSLFYLGLYQIDFVFIIIFLFYSVILF